MWGAVFVYPTAIFVFLKSLDYLSQTQKLQTPTHERTAYQRTTDQSAQLHGHLCDHATGVAAGEQDTPQPRAFLGGGPQPCQQGAVCGAHWPGRAQPGERRPARCVPYGHLQTGLPTHLGAQPPQRQPQGDGCRYPLYRPYAKGGQTATD